MTELKTTTTANNSNKNKKINKIKDNNFKTIPKYQNGDVDVSTFTCTCFGPGVDSASNRNEYQESFLGVKTAGA
jgi:hypothetical protein